MRLQWGHCLPAWKFRNSCDDGNGNRFLLQWGHAFRQWKWRLAVESRTVWIASMGPPPSGSGNSYLCLDSDFRPCSRAIFAS